MIRRRAGVTALVGAAAVTVLVARRRRGKRARPGLVMLPWLALWSMLRPSLEWTFPWDEVYGLVAGFIAAVIPGVSFFIDSMVNAIKGAVSSAVNAIVDEFRGVWSVIGQIPDLFPNLVDWVEGVFVRIRDLGATWLEDAAHILAQVPADLWREILAGAGFLSGSIADLVHAVITGASWFEQLVISIVSGAVSEILGASSWFAQAVYTIIAAALHQLLAGATWLWDELRDVAIPDLLAIVQTLIDDAIGGLEDALGLLDAVRTFLEWVATVVIDDLIKFLLWGLHLVETDWAELEGTFFAGGIEGWLSKVGDAIDSDADEAVAFVDRIFG